MIKNGIDSKISDSLNEYADDIDELTKLGILVDSSVKTITDFDEIPLRPKLIENFLIEVNNWCNQRCKHCYFYNNSFRDKAYMLKTIEIDSIKKAIMILRYLDVKIISLVGGRTFISWS